MGGGWGGGGDGPRGAAQDGAQHKNGEPSVAGGHMLHRRWERVVGKDGSSEAE